MYYQIPQTIKCLWFRGGCNVPGEHRDFAGRPSWHREILIKGKTYRACKSCCEKYQN